MYLRFFLPSYLVAYVLAAFAWRTYVVRKTTGINPVTFKGSDSAHDFVGQIFKLLFAIIVAVVIVFSFFAWGYEYLLPIAWLERLSVRWIGVALLLLSLVWTVVAQAQMGQSWRIGVDSERQTELVQQGVFRISRNPIFLGMMITLLGLFLVLPNGIMLLTLMLGVVIIGIQVRLEEEHLRKLHGAEYVDYYRRVRRWI